MPRRLECRKPARGNNLNIREENTRKENKTNETDPLRTRRCEGSSIPITTRLKWWNSEPPARAPVCVFYNRPCRMYRVADRETRSCYITSEITAQPAGMLRASMHGFPLVSRVNHSIFTYTQLFLLQQNAGSENKTGAAHLWKFDARLFLHSKQ